MTPSQETSTRTPCVGAINVYLKVTNADRIMYINATVFFPRITISLAIITKSSVCLCHSLTDPKMRSSVFLLILGLTL
ncbi:hypothetical protein LSAT2_011783 [Lamellibrachia satsuma]|nr:hypothetical protein LSAT2_011783 [Lamellibrachia satsuma]